MQYHTFKGDEGITPKVKAPLAFGMKIYHVETSHKCNKSLAVLNIHHTFHINMLCQCALLGFCFICFSVYLVGFHQLQFFCNLGSKHLISVWYNMKECGQGNVEDRSLSISALLVMFLPACDTAIRRLHRGSGTVGNKKYCPWF